MKEAKREAATVIAKLRTEKEAEFAASSSAVRFFPFCVSLESFDRRLRRKTSSRN